MQESASNYLQTLNTKCWADRTLSQQIDRLCLRCFCNCNLVHATYKQFHLLLLGWSWQGLLLRCIYLFLSIGRCILSFSGIFMFYSFASNINLCPDLCLGVHSFSYFCPIFFYCLIITALHLHYICKLDLHAYSIRRRWRRRRWRHQHRILTYSSAST